MTRRELLQGLLAAGVWTAFEGRGFAAQPSSMKEIEELQKNWKGLLAEGVKVPLPSEPLKLSKDEWRKRLSSEQFDVLRVVVHDQDRRLRQERFVVGQRLRRRRGGRGGVRLGHGA